MRFASLGSGSEGNALVVERGRTRLMVDCGFGLADACRRLARLAVAPDELSAILVTHEHGDHLGGVARLALKYGLPVWLSHGTLSQWQAERLPQVEIFDSHSLFAIEELQVQPYPVPHDAREPAQFVFSDGARRLGLLTDAGSVTAHMVDMLSGLDALVLECNHDAGMLAGGPYPPFLKQRVGGAYGHLENGQAEDLLRRVDQSRLRHVVAAHLSAINNTPELACAALARALGCAQDWVATARQDSGLSWRSIQ